MPPPRIRRPLAVLTGHVFPDSPAGVHAALGKQRWSYLP